MKTMRNLLFFGITLALLCATADQNVQAQPLRLSFGEAWDLAQKNNADLQIAKMNLEKANAQIGEAVSAALPVIQATGYYQRNFIIPEQPIEFGGQTITIKFQQENLWNGGITLQQPIYAAGRVGRALQIAKLYRQATEEQGKVTQAQVKLEITRLYFGAVVAGEWERVSQETYRQMLDQLERARRMHQEGLVSEYDLIRSQVQVSNFYPQVIASVNSRKVAVEALSIALGLPRNQELELTDGMEAYPTPSLPDEDYFSVALQHRPEFRQLDLQENIQNKLFTIEKHGVWWPNLALVGGYTLSAQESDFQFDDYFWSKNLYGGISLSIPLFDGFKAKYRAEQVRVDRKKLGIQRTLLEKGVNLEIVQARNKLEEAQKNIKAQEEGVALAQKGLSIAEVQYENGLATQLELMDAQIALNQAKMNRLSAKYEYITALAELEKALGKE